MNTLKTTLLASVAALCAAGAASADGTIAYFASASQNGFSQATFEGIQAAAAERGYEAEMLDGQFDAALQYAQIEDALASGRFVGMIIAPNDSVGIAGAVEQAVAEGIPIGTVLFPVGPDLNTLEPQVEGLTVTAASPPVAGATVQAEAVVAHCADIDPCNVVIVIGARIFPFDNLRLETFEAVLGQHENIEVIAVGEGYYSPDPSLQAMTDILQSHPDVDVVLSNADQHLVGVEIALESVGIDPADVYLSGGGAAAIAIEAIREGRWDATLAYFPRTMGALAMEQIANALEGEPVTHAINMDEAGPIEAMIDLAVLEANPGFVGEWEQ